MNFGLNPRNLTWRVEFGLGALIEAKFWHTALKLDLKHRILTWSFEVEFSPRALKLDMERRILTWSSEVEFLLRAPKLDM